MPFLLAQEIHERRLDDPGAHGERRLVHVLEQLQLRYHFGEVDVLINNAGIVDSADFLDLDEEDFDRVLRVNLKGTFLVGQIVARQMVEQIEAGKSPGTIAYLRPRFSQGFNWFGARRPNEFTSRNASNVFSKATLGFNFREALVSNFQANINFAGQFAGMIYYSKKIPLADF